MSEYLTALKDIIVIFSPIVVAYISYKSNKKSRKEIQLEIENTLKEKDAETNQILQKMSAELENQKQLSVWNNSLPQTDKYAELAGTERYGNISGISALVNYVRTLLNNNDYTHDDLVELQKLLSKIKLPLDGEALFPYEIPYIISYKNLVRDIDHLLQEENK